MKIGSDNSTLTSRFKNLPLAVVNKIQKSPEFNQPHIQQMLKKDTVEIRFQGNRKNGEGEIVTSGKIPEKFVLDGFIKAALVQLGFKGNEVKPYDEPADMFIKTTESNN